jgi:hypothetical protein
MKKLLPLVMLFLASACGPRVPTELNGKIVVLEETGQRIKLRWYSGHGEKWAFYQEVKVVTSTSTNAVWIPYGTGIQSK